MDLNEQAPPAKCRKLDTDLAENEADDESARNKNSYASEVSRRQYLNKRTADVFFIFEGSNERVPAHKSVLAAASDVFDKMFYGPMAVNGDVPLPGKSPEAFKSFLQFCYLDEVILKADNITDVMSLLHEYQMKESLLVCGKFLADNWTVEDICSMYEWAINLQMDELQVFCERMISIHIVKVFKTDCFLSSPYNVLAHILDFDSLLCDETMVLDACLNWARFKCKQNGQDENDMGRMREYLTNNWKCANVFYKIRYGSIAHAEFLNYFDSNDGLFVDGNEREDVMRLLLGSKNSKTGKFLTEPRQPFGNAMECDLLSGPRLDQKDFVSKQVINVMTVDGLVLLEGFYNVPLFARFGSSSFPAELSIKEQSISEKTESNVVYTDLITFKDNQELYFKFKPNAIVLKSGFQYHFQFCFNQSDIRYDCFEMIKKIKINKFDSMFSRDDNAPFIIKKLKLKTLN